MRCPRNSPLQRVSHAPQNGPIKTDMHRHNDLDAEYYISKNIIPPLERIFNLVGANVRSWYDEMPKVQRVRRVEAADIQHAKDPFTKKTLESYMKASICLVCRSKVESDIPLCDNCLAQRSVSLWALNRQIGKDERKAVKLERICRSCASLPCGDVVNCDSKDCPVFYSRTRQMAILRSTNAVVRPVIKVLESQWLGVADVHDW